MERDSVKAVPVNILRCMNQDDRKKLGKFGLLPEELNAKAETESEKSLQRLIYLELTRRGLFFHYSRMDKKTTTRKGTPDFALPIRNVGYVAIECKTSIGSITEEQAEARSNIWKQGGEYIVVRSFDHFLNILKDYGL